MQKQLYDVFNGNEFLLRAPITTLSHVFMLHKAAEQRIVHETMMEGGQCAFSFNGRTFFGLGTVIIQRAQ